MKRIGIGLLLAIILSLALVSVAAAVVPSGCGVCAVGVQSSHFFSSVKSKFSQKIEVWHEQRSFPKMKLVK